MEHSVNNEVRHFGRLRRMGEFIADVFRSIGQADIDTNPNLSDARRAALNDAHDKHK